MHLGLMMECDYRKGQTQREAFDEALLTAETAEDLGFDGVWLAERHFSTPGGAVSPDPMKATTCPIRRAGNGFASTSRSCDWPGPGKVSPIQGHFTHVRT